MKHKARIDDVSRVPCADVSIEGVSTQEHAIHVGDVACVPSCKRLIKPFVAVEHESKVGDLTYVPVTDGLIKRVRTIEHSVHCLRVRCIPTTNVLVETRS